jgi:transcriptional regulator with XRE-family HTH domain
MEKNFKKQFGTRVRYLRKLSGLNQEQVAELTGLSTKTISYIENAKNTLSFNKLPLLAKALNVPVYKLFVFTDFDNNKDTLFSLLNSATEKEVNVITEVITSILALK